MGDSRRFDLFAKAIANNFPPALYQNIADVGGGKGYLQLALKEHGYKQVTTFDKRRRRLHARGNFRCQPFGGGIKDNFHLIVGMHPDEATDVIIVEAARRKIPFAICPCCVRPSAIVFKGVKANYRTWVEHLEGEATKRGYDVIKVFLRMSGKNAVLIGRPR